MITGTAVIHIAATNTDLVLSVEVERTSAELQAGYSNIAQPANGNAKVFDIGGGPGKVASSSINMGSMLFPLDILSIGEVVVGGVLTGQVIAAVQSAVQPAAQGIAVAGVRYFLEAPAGYLTASGIAIGDTVTFDANTAALLAVATSTGLGIDISSIMNLMITMMIVVMMMKMMTGSMAGLSSRKLLT